MGSGEPHAAQVAAMDCFACIATDSLRYIMAQGLNKLPALLEDTSTPWQGILRWPSGVCSSMRNGKAVCKPDLLASCWLMWTHRRLHTPLMQSGCGLRSPLQFPGLTLHGPLCL